VEIVRSCTRASAGSGCGPGMVRIHVGFIEWLVPTRQIESLGSDWEPN
jgi:hypothetical protein